jgi:hypothetical protein
MPDGGLWKAEVGKLHWSLVSTCTQHCFCALHTCCAIVRMKRNEMCHFVGVEICTTSQMITYNQKYWPAPMHVTKYRLHVVVQVYPAHSYGDTGLSTHNAWRGPWFQLFVTSIRWISFLRIDSSWNQCWVQRTFAWHRCSWYAVSAVSWHWTW